MGMWVSTPARALGIVFPGLIDGRDDGAGPTAFTRIPRLAYSSASVRVMLPMAPLLSEYPRKPGFGMI